MIIQLVYLGNHRLVRILVRLLYFRVAGIILRRKQIALGHRYSSHYIARTIRLRVKIQVLHYLLYGRLAVVCVVNRKRVDISNLGCLRPQYSGKHRMERPHPYIAGFRPHKLHDALLHLRCRLVRKGQRQYIERVDTRAYQVGNAVRQGTRLAAPCSGYYHHRTFSTCRSLTLRLVKLRKNIVIHFNSVKNPKINSQFTKPQSPTHTAWKGHHTHERSATGAQTHPFGNPD